MFFLPSSASQVRRSQVGRPARGRPGFTFLIAALIIGVIVSGMTISLILLGLGAQQSGLTILQSAQAYENAQTCAERALRSLRRDLSYDGGETFTLTNGTCSIAHTGGSGNGDRALCVAGESGRTTRRMEIGIKRVYPDVRITSWKEVDAFTLCP